MTPSVFPALEALLPRVAKPVQYVGGELNARTKDWEAAAVRWALLYPDAYEVGLPNQGVQILYELINERPDALCERVFSPWPDLEDRMRKEGIPLFSVDSHRPVREFDLFGISLQSELQYSNVLNLLELAGLPYFAKDRGPIANERVIEEFPGRAIYYYDREQQPALRSVVLERSYGG